MPNDSNAWNVNFNNGNVNNNSKDNNNYVRPVRGGAWEDIYRCYLRCRKGKRNTVNALRFELNLEDNICRLQEELMSGTYRPSRSVCFAVKKPKMREIFASDFRDRIVHHILVERLEEIYEPKFIYDSWACRKNKGTHGALRRLRKFLRQATLNGTRKAWYLQLDIRSFFMNIDKDILFNLIKKETSDSYTLRLLKVILYHDYTADCRVKGDVSLLKKIPPHKTLFHAPPGRGLPIGNLTSQFFANVYLNELDQYVKRSLRCRHYIRYCDDFVILSESRERLLFCEEKISEFLIKRLRLELHRKRRRLRPVSDGIDFVGYIIRPDYTLVRRRVAAACRSALKEFKKRYVSPDGTVNFEAASAEKIRDIWASYRAHFSHADSYRLRKSFEEKFGFLGEILDKPDLAQPRYFPSMAGQYEFFRRRLKKPEFLTDRDGQIYFTEGRAVIFFRVGSVYRLFGDDARAAVAVLNLKPAESRVSFPAALKKRYSGLMRNAGYRVYTVEQKKDIQFGNRLLTRVLTEGG